MSNLDYKKFRTAVLKSCRAKERDSVSFTVDFANLQKLASELEPKLRVVSVSPKSRPVSINDVALLSEYFKNGPELSWFDEYKQFNTVVLVEEESIDEKCEKLLNNLTTELADNPEIDKVKSIAEIIANYPCYFATVISYMNNDPRRIGKCSYEIKCRANKVVIKSEGYNYNSQDMA